MRKTIISAFILSCALLSAQDDTKREVTLEREYSPVISDAGKMSADIEPLELKTGQHEVQYWMGEDRSLYPEMTFTPMGVADPNFADQPQNRGYARLALGYRWNTLADFGYRIKSNKNTQFDINIHHLGTFGQKQYSRSTLDMNLEKKLKALTIFGGVELGFDHWNYYALYQEDPFTEGGKPIANSKFSYDWDKDKNWESGTDWNRMWNFNFDFGIKNNINSDVKYNINLGYHLSNVEDKWVLHKQITENSVFLNGDAEWELNTGSLGFTSHFKHHFYNKYSADEQDLLLNERNEMLMDGVPLGWAGVMAVDQSSTGKTYFDMKLQPYYAYSGNQAWVHVGINLDFSFGCVHNVGISPQVEMEWQAMPSMLALYGIFTGRLGGHELQSSLRGNHYADPYTVTYTDCNTYTPIDATVGLKIHPTNGLILNLYGNYMHTLGELFPVFGYVNPQCTGYRTYGTFRPDGYDLQMFRMGLSARYEYKDKLRLDADVHYNFLKPKEVKRWEGIDEQYAWYKPAFEGRLALAWHITPKWTIQLDSYFATPAHALVEMIDCMVSEPMPDDPNPRQFPYNMRYAAVKLEPVYDINLGVTYNLNKNVAFFANATNIAYNKRMMLYGYEQQLTSFIIGASFQF